MPGSSKPWEGLEEVLGGGGSRCSGSSQDHGQAAEGTKRDGRRWTSGGGIPFVSVRGRSGGI